MSVLLPVGIPAGFTPEPATGAHVEAFRLVAAEQTAAFGFCPETEEDVRSVLEPPAAAASTEYLVRDCDGAVMQWWGVLRDPGDPITHAWISTHPRLRDADADALARAGWAAMLDWIRVHRPEGVDDDIQVHLGCPAGSAPNPRHLAEAGFTQQRTFWEMLGPVSDEARSAPQVPGLVIEASRDVATIHGVPNQGFVGHYGFTPTTLEDWLAVEETMAGFDPDLRYLATIDGEPAAAMLLRPRRVETQGAMYVGALATLEQFRRRGIATGLPLAHGFEWRPAKVWGIWRCMSTARTLTLRRRCTGARSEKVRTAFWAYARPLSL